MALYSPDGNIRITITDGTQLTGAQAPDGSYYAVINDGTQLTGVRHPSGALNAIVSDENTSVQAPNGSIYIRESTGGYVVSVPNFGGPTDFLAPTFLSLSSPSADAWCWFHEPRAVSKDNKMWFGTTGSNDNSVLTGRASLYEVDERNNTVLRKDLATSTVAATWADDHDYPTAPVFRPDGRLVTFYCPHRTGGPINYRISISPGTIADGWSKEYSIAGPDHPTYPSPVFLSDENNKLYLFYRNGSSGGPLSFLTSDDIAYSLPAVEDEGDLAETPTFSAEKQVVVSAGTQGIYHKVTSNGIDRIDILMTDAEAAQAGTKTDVRHTYLQGGNFHTTAGSSLGDASTLIPFTNFTPVATSGLPDSLGDMWCDHIQVRDGGIIEAVFHVFASTSDHRLYYARWNGSAWFKTEVDAGYGMGVPDTRSTQITDGLGISEGYYSPGAFLDTKEEGVFYCGVGTSEYSQIYRYTTTDGGNTFTRERVSDLLDENVRPVVPVNRTNKYAVLWMNGLYHYYDFNINPEASNIGYTTRISAASKNYSASEASPSNVVLPTIGGSTGTEGNELQANKGSWTGEMPMTFSYQWVKEGVDIVGATSDTYTITTGDVGSSITVKVTATNYLDSTLEESAAASNLPTNLITHSETFNQWANNSVTTVADVANDPINGQAVADRMVESVGLVGHNWTAESVSINSGTTYTFSIYGKYETAPYVQILFGGAAFGSNAWANFNLQTGTVETKGSAATSSVVDVGNGWYRLIATATATGTTSAPIAIYAINSASSTRAQSHAGNTNNTRLLFGAQLETGSSANTYVPTA